MKLSTKLFGLVCVLATIATLVIKLYFIPKTDHFLDLSIRDQMRRDMASFERIILVVVKAARNNPDYVRQALLEITRDPNIPIELRRSPIIERQYGVKKGHEVRDAFERDVMRGGRPRFRTTSRNLEYVYPLKVRAVCRNCHAGPGGKPLPDGAVLGLAVKRVPLSAPRESSLTFFIMDLFWENLVLVGILLGGFLAVLFVWVVRPAEKIAGILQESLAMETEEEEEESEPEAFSSRDEMGVIREGVARLLERFSRRERD